MRVTFTKTGSRRYGVHVERENAPALAIRSAPGFDTYLPHDLLHFVAEAEWNLDGGVFGDLAAGGNARIFVPVDQELVAKIWRKNRKRRYRLRDGRRSEELAGALEHAWHRRRFGQRVADPELERLMPKLDELAEQWHTLPVGESITLEWPRPERRRAKRAAR
jgi:hypothetical protein